MAKWTSKSQTDEKTEKADRGFIHAALVSAGSYQRLLGGLP
jgi:hypothetical protein